jgi:hypothetical protein
MRFAWVVCAVSLLGPLSARANTKIVFPEEELPETVSQVSIGATSRAVRAYVQDWYDDARSYQEMQQKTCRRAPPAAQEVTAAYLPVLKLMGELDRASPDRETSIRSALAELSGMMGLTPAERNTIQRLSETEVGDELDAMEFEVDARWLLIRVAKRQYAELVELYQSQGSTVWACTALTLRLERDSALMRGANGILSTLNAE